MKYIYRSLLVLLLLVVQGFSWTAQASQAVPMRYLVKPVESYYRGYIWLWYADSPYTVISEMCWDENFGYECDERIATIDFELTYEVFDTGSGLNGSIYRLDNGEFFIFWWPQELGADHNPHPISAYWIDYVSLGEFLGIWRQ